MPLFSIDQLLNDESNDLGFQNRFSWIRDRLFARSLDVTPGITAVT